MEQKLNIFDFVDNMEIVSKFLDCRVVVNRAVYDRIKEIGGWSEGFIDSLIVVSDYIE